MIISVDKRYTTRYFLHLTTVFYIKNATTAPPCLLMWNMMLFKNGNKE